MRVLLTHAIPANTTQFTSRTSEVLNVLQKNIASRLYKLKQNFTPSKKIKEKWIKSTCKLQQAPRLYKTTPDVPLSNNYKLPTFVFLLSGTLLSKTNTSDDIDTTAELDDNTLLQTEPYIISAGLEAMTDPDEDFEDFANGFIFDNSGHIVTCAHAANKSIIWYCNTVDAHRRFYKRLASDDYSDTAILEAVLPENINLNFSKSQLKANNKTLSLLSRFTVPFFDKQSDCPSFIERYFTVSTKCSRYGVIWPLWYAPDMPCSGGMILSNQGFEGMSIGLGGCRIPCTGAAERRRACTLPLCSSVLFTPAQTVIFSAHSLIQYGCVVHHLLGFNVATSKEGNRLYVENGIFPASDQTLMTHDIILNISGENITSIQQFAHILSKKSIASLNRWLAWRHTQLAIDVMRGGKKKTVHLVFAQKRDYSEPFRFGHF
ncbi:S1C family serine protease [Kistimonas asteriae]|uniref:S1C family serine protease n=1 Tax=Kistimonas asteriae TaxID=517724 RepID=UPI001BA81D2D|nr:S1C family serine protease [Kistimonas asteriae]